MSRAKRVYTPEQKEAGRVRSAARYHRPEVKEATRLRNAARAARPEIVAAIRLREKARRTRPEVKESDRQSKARPEVREAMRAALYGLTVPQLRAVIGDGLCRICGDPGTDIDHDHACCPGRKACGRCVRGLVCRDCNRGLGGFNDDPVRLAAATGYIYAARDRRDALDGIEPP